jgi:molybdopterin/thiamine biosynthesis adenylyltransferase
LSTQTRSQALLQQLIDSLLSLLVALVSCVLWPAGLFALKELCKLLSADIGTALELVKQQPSLLDTPSRTLEAHVRVSHAAAAASLASSGSMYLLTVAGQVYICIIRLQAGSICTESKCVIAVAGVTGCRTVTEAASCMAVIPGDAAVAG